MKLWSFIAFLTVIALSCNKSSNSNKDETEVKTTTGSGTWSILMDSTYDGVGTGNHLVLYKGKSGDYFDFKDDGTCLVSENGALDTLKYTLYPDSKIVMTDFGLTVNGIPDTSTISGLTTQSMTITSDFFPTPAGIFGRKVVLSR